MKRLILLACLIAIGCGKDSTPTTPAVVIPNYTGIWTGTYTVTSCTQNGTITLANLCGDTFATGANLPFMLNLIQQGSTIIQGTFTLGQIPFDVVPATLTSAGTVTVSGSSLSGTLTLLTTWNLVTPITGTLGIVISAGGLTGQVNVTANIGAVTKTGSVGQHVAAPQSLHELMRAIQGQ